MRLLLKLALWFLLGIVTVGVSGFVYIMLSEYGEDFYP